MQNSLTFSEKQIVPKVIRNKSIFWYMWMTILMFFYIYEFNLDAFGMSTYLTSRRLVVAVLLFQVLLQYKKNWKPQGIAKKTLKDISLFHVFLLVYSLILIAVFGRGVGNHVRDDILRFFFFGLFPVWCFYKLFDTVEELMRVLLLTSLIQSFFIVGSLIDPAFGEMLDTTFATGEKTDFIISHRPGYAGGLACITAPGCLRFSMGIVASFYFAVKRNDILSVLVFVVLSIICSMVARTGLFIGIVGLVLMSYRKGAINFVKYISSLIVILFIILFFTSRINVLEFFDFYRMEDLLYGEGGSTFVQGYFGAESTRIPPLTFETIVFGTGIVSGVTDSGIHVNVDGGFLRLYSAYGLILCILFYLVMFSSFLKNVFGEKNGLLKLTLLFFTLVILIGELKEYTIYQQYMVCLFFTLAVLVNKQKIIIS